MRGHRIHGSVQDVVQVLVHLHEALRLHVRVGGRPHGQPQLGAHARHREQHAAPLAPAVLLLMPGVRRAVGDMRMADHLPILEAIGLLQLVEERAQSLQLLERHGLVVVPHHLDADRVRVAVLLAVPHGAAGVERLAVAVDDAIDRPVLHDAVVRLAALGELVERALRVCLGGVQHDERRRLAQAALLVARRAVVVLQHERRGKRLAACQRGESQADQGLQGH